MSLRAIVFCVIGILLLYGMFTTGFPFLLALVVAIFLERPVQWLIKYGNMGRMAASSIVSTVFTAAMMGFFYLIGFKIVSELIQFWNKAPNYLNDAQKFFDNTSEKTKTFYNSLPSGVAEQIHALLEGGTSALAENIKGIVTTVSAYFLGIAKMIPSLLMFCIVFVVGLYLISYSFPTLHKSFLNLFEKKSQSKVLSVLNDLRRALLGFLFAQLLISLLTYVVTLIGLLLLRVDYPLAIALLIVVVDVLPILGTSAVLIPWALYCMLSGNMFLGIGLLILLIIIMLFRRLVEPKIIGNAVGINALAALASMYIGFEWIGVTGLILGPVLVIVYQALRRVGLVQINIKFD